MASDLVNGYAELLANIDDEISGLSQGYALVLLQDAKSAIEQQQARIAELEQEVGRKTSALERIAANEETVFDDVTQTETEVSMEAEVMAAIAYQALQTIRSETDAD